MVNNMAAICPFCGSVKIEFGGSLKDKGIYIYCKNCKAQGPKTFNEDSAIELWNDEIGRIMRRL